MRSFFWMTAAVAIFSGCGDDVAGPYDLIGSGLGADLAMRDLAMSIDLSTADLSTPDLAMPDFSMPDLAMPDLTPPIDLAGCTVCSGVCVELATDPNNCGACGHVCGCGSTSCTGGYCDPQKISDHVQGAYALFVDSGTVYYSADGPMTVSSVAVTGGLVTQLLINVPVIRGMTGDATSLYFTRTNFNVIETGPRAGGGVHNFSPSAEPTPFGITSDGTTLFWVDLGSANLRAQALGTSSVSSIETGQAGLSGVATDETYVYWTTSGAVLRALKAGGAITTVAGSQAHPVGVAVDGTNAYWVNGGDGAVSMGPKDGSGSITPIATGQMTPTNIAVDATTVFWTEQGGGKVWRAPIAGGAPVAIAIGQVLPSTIALDASCVYFADFGSGAAADGSINRSPKQ